MRSSPWLSQTRTYFFLVLAPFVFFFWWCVVIGRTKSGMKKITVSQKTSHGVHNDMERKYGMHYGTLYKHLKSLQSNALVSFGRDEFPFRRFLDAVEEVPCQPGAIAVTKYERVVPAREARASHTKSGPGAAADTQLTRWNGVDGSGIVTRHRDGSKPAQLTVDMPVEWTGPRSNKLLRMDTAIRGAHNALLENVARCNIDYYDLADGRLRVFLFVVYRDKATVRVEAKSTTPADVEALGSRRIDLATLKRDDLDNTKVVVFQHEGTLWCVPNERPYDQNTLFRVSSAAPARDNAFRTDGARGAVVPLASSRDVCYLNKRSSTSTRQCPVDVSFLPPVHPGVSLSAVLFEGAIFDVKLYDNTVLTVMVRSVVRETLSASALNACFSAPMLMPLKGLNPPTQSNLSRGRRLVLARSPQRTAPRGKTWIIDGLLVRSTRIESLVNQARASGFRTLLINAMEWELLTRETPLISRCKSMVVQCSTSYARLTWASNTIWDIEDGVHVERSDIATVFATMFFAGVDVARITRGMLERRASFSPSEFNIHRASFMTLLERDVLLQLPLSDDLTVCIRPDEAIALEDVVMFRGPYIDSMQGSFRQTSSSCDTTSWKEPLRRRAEYLARATAFRPRDIGSDVTFTTTTLLTMDGSSRAVAWRVFGVDYDLELIGQRVSGHSHMYDVHVDTDASKTLVFVSASTHAPQLVQESMASLSAASQFFGIPVLLLPSFTAKSSSDPLSTHYTVLISLHLTALNQTAPHQLAGRIDTIAEDETFVTIVTTSGTRETVANPVMVEPVDGRMVAFRKSTDVGKFVAFFTKSVVEINNTSRHIRWPDRIRSRATPRADASQMSGVVAKLNRRIVTVQTQPDGMLIDIDHPELSVDPSDTRVFVFTLCDLSMSGVPLTDFFSNLTRVASEAFVDEQRGIVTAEVADFHGTPRVVAYYDRSACEPPFYIRLIRDRQTRADADIFCNIRIHSDLAISRFVRSHDAFLNVTCRRLPELTATEGRPIVGRGSSILNLGNKPVHFPDSENFVVRGGLDGTRSARVTRANEHDFDDAMAYGLRHNYDALLTLQQWLDTAHTGLTVVRNPGLTFVRDDLSAKPDGFVVASTLHISVDEQGGRYVVSDLCDAWQQTDHTDNSMHIEPHWFVEDCVDDALLDDFDADPPFALLRVLQDAIAAREGVTRFSAPASAGGVNELDPSTRWWRNYTVVIDTMRYVCRFAPRCLDDTTVLPETFCWQSLHLACPCSYRAHAFVEAKCHMQGRNIMRINSNDDYMKQVCGQSAVVGLRSGYFVSWSTKHTTIFEVEASAREDDTASVVLPVQLTKSCIRHRPRAMTTRMQMTDYSVIPTTHTLRCTPITSSTEDAQEMHILRKIKDGTDTAPADGERGRVLQTTLPVTTYAPAVVLCFAGERPPDAPDTEAEIRRRVGTLLGLDEHMLELRLPGASKRLTGSALQGMADLTVVHVTGTPSHTRQRFARRTCQPANASWIGREVVYAVGEGRDEDTEQMHQRMLAQVVGEDPHKTDRASGGVRVLCVVDCALVNAMQPKLHAYADGNGVSHVLVEDAQQWRAYATLSDAFLASGLSNELCVQLPSAPLPRLGATLVDGRYWPNVTDQPIRLVHVAEASAYAVAENPISLLSSHMSRLAAIDTKSMHEWQMWWTDLFTILMLQVDTERVLLSIDPKLACIACTDAAVEAAVKCGEMIADAADTFVPSVPALNGTGWMVFPEPAPYSYEECILLQSFRTHHDPISTPFASSASLDLSSITLIDDGTKFRFDKHGDQTGLWTAQRVQGPLYTYAQTELLETWTRLNRSTQFQTNLGFAHRRATDVQFEGRRYTFVPVDDAPFPSDHQLLRHIYHARKRPRFEDSRIENAIIAKLAV